MSDNIKHSGQVYTPDFLVTNILDYVGYCGEGIIKRHIIDNSCGDGAFICEIVKRYCSASTSSTLDKKEQLETYIHGIEIDEDEHKKCLKRVSETAAAFGITDVKWDIVCADALQVSRYDRLMDYVVGNPPYVRVHNLTTTYNSVKQFDFAKRGMTDLYIVFFEIGFRMMSDNGKMCIITSSSWLTSSAGKALRAYILNSRSLTGVIDLEHYQPFDATTYTIISRFENNSDSHKVEYCTYNISLHERLYMCSLNIADMVIDGAFYISAPESLKILRKIKTTQTKQIVTVKNGFATLADKVFIGNFSFESHKIAVIKASTGVWSECFYPYDHSGKPLVWNDFTQDHLLVEFLYSNKNKLQNGRDIEDKKAWWLFGRSQAISDVAREKIAVNSLVKDTNSIKINRVKAGAGVFGGLFVTYPQHIGFETIKSIINSEDFIEYIKLLKNYKNGGYYTFSSKDLSQFLNYKLNSCGNDDKRPVLQCTLQLFP